MISLQAEAVIKVESKASYFIKLAEYFKVMYVNALSVGMRHMLQLGKRTFLILKYLVRISPSFANTLKQVSKI